MKMKNLAWMVALVVLAGAAIYISIQANSDTAERTQPNQPEQTAKSPRSKDSLGSGIEWLTNYDEALGRAKNEKKLVVVDLFATWCEPCKLMDRTTFIDDGVRLVMEDFVPLRIDIDKQRDLAAKFGIRGIPATFIIEPDGKNIASAVGFLDAERFVSLLTEAKEAVSPRSEG